MQETYAATRSPVANHHWGMVAYLMGPFQDNLHVGVH